MKKRILSIMLVLILAVSILPISASAAGSLSNFAKIKAFSPGLFKDVPSTQWYADEVQLTYEYDLFNGKTSSTFEPDSNLRICEAIKLAAVMHSFYTTGKSTLTTGTPVWYQPYVDYALQNGIIQSNYSNYDAFATRSDFAKIFAAALPEEALPQKNTIDDNTIPDVKINYDYGPAVYLLYRAGVLTGAPNTHAYSPLDNIKRAEVAAITARMVSSSFREAFSISTKELTDTQIAAKCSPAVFFIEVYNQAGQALGSGSGFFISSAGLAVTNFHVIDGVSSAKITTKDGKTYDVSGVYDYSEQNDLALLQINGTGFSYLEIGDSTVLQTGANIFAIGYPRGIDQTFTDGKITNAAHMLEGVSVILNNAQISPGSSGGALVNTKGQVIGVTSGYYVDAQNLNFAMPIHLINGLSRTNYVPLSSITSQTTFKVTATPSTVSVARGAQVTVNINETSGIYDLNVSYKDTIVDCTWADWTDDYNCPLIITGLSAGTTTVKVELLDDNDNVLASTNITVTVTGGSATTTYYSGYYPVPDFGTYTGAPLFTSYYGPTTGGTAYYYKIDTIPMGPETYVSGYDALLEQNGCTYLGSFTDDDGYTKMTYSYGNLYIYVGATQYNGSNCIMILVIPD